MKIIFTIMMLSLLLSCSDRKIDYLKFKESQDYKVPLFEDSFKNKTALFIFPHPDDEIVCGGTIAQLKKNGWIINLLTLTQGQQPDEKKTRTSEWKVVVQDLGFNNFEIMDLPNNSWDNVMNNKISFWHDNQDSIENIIYNSIKKYKPTIIFTYDTAFGGYGHPEHRVSAIAVNKVFQKHKNDTSFSVERIFQITLPEKFEQLALGSTESYKNAIKITGNTTLPDPTIAFDISKEWNAKRNAASLYTSQAQIMKKFFLLPEIHDTTEHFKTFDREYYFEIKK